MQVPLERLTKQFTSYRLTILHAHRLLYQTKNIKSFTNAIGSCLPPFCHATLIIVCSTPSFYEYIIYIHTYTQKMIFYTRILSVCLLYTYRKDRQEAYHYTRYSRFVEIPIFYRTSQYVHFRMLELYRREITPYVKMQLQ